MQRSQRQYKFYATLLDAFQWYRVSESESAEQDLIDKINRKPVTDIEAIARMNRGTALNQLVDNAVEYGTIDETVIIDGVEYTFPADLVQSLAQRFAGAVTQLRCSTNIVLQGGAMVELYGNLDYLCEDVVIDLKTTSSYDLAKYKDSMQRHLYPVCLQASGIEINSFEFVSVEIKSKGFNVFSESYPFNPAESMAELREVSTGLIDFIEARRDLITDLKVFGMDGIIASPIDEGMIVTSL